jgi:hypothetical protein
MKHVQLLKVLLVLAALFLAVGLTTSSPVLAARDGSTQQGGIEGPGSGNGKDHAYGYGSGSGSGCDDKSEAAWGSQPATFSNATRADVTLPFAAAKVSGAATGGRPLTASLTGAEEVPGPGDADGAGSAFITLNQGRNGLLGAVGDGYRHRHRCSYPCRWLGVAGPVVVTLSAPEDGSSFGCTSVDAEADQRDRQNPSGFYVNVHNADFPAGTLRAGSVNKHICQSRGRPSTFWDGPHLNIEILEARPQT